MPIVFGSKEAEEIKYANKDERALIQAEIAKYEALREQSQKKADFTFSGWCHDKISELSNELDALEAQWADEIADSEGMPNYMSADTLEGKP